MQSSAIPPPHVGIFDSGIGGLSVLRSLRQLLPGCALSYLADNRYLPYGDRSADWLTARALQLTEYLLAQGAGLILVACNTATTHTIAALRARWPNVPFVGVEPGIKPAVLRSRAGRIAVMATPATLRSARLQRLIDLHAGGCAVRLLPCTDLAQAIEQADDARLSCAVESACAQARAEAVDVVVLGCTHYPLVADRLAAALGPGIYLLDTGEAVARRVQSVLGTAAASGKARGALTAIATGDTQPLDLALERWLHEPLRATHRDC